MRLFRPCYLAALLALLSPSLLQAASTGVLTCQNLAGESAAPGSAITVSYFDISPPAVSTSISTSGAGAGKATFGTVTIHAALQQFGVLAPSIGSEFTSCTLTHNSLTFTFFQMLLTNVDGIAGAASTGGAGAATYTQAVFSFASVTFSGGNDGDSGGEDAGRNRTTNVPNPNGTSPIT